MQTRKVALFDIASVRSDKVAGRYFFHLVQDFIAAGYQPAYKAHFRFIATFKTARYKGYLLDRAYRFYDDPASLIQEYESVILITDRASVYHSSSLEHRVLVNYDYRRASAEEIPLTFGLGPGIFKTHGDLPQVDRSAARDMKVYFAGNTSSGYAQDFLGKHYGMLNRREVIEAVKTRFADALYVPPEVHDDAEPLPLAKAPIVLLSKDNRRIDPLIWLDTMARSDFFLACPGVEMPMCHNLVEAISVGTIPIIEYESYLEPGLEDGVNCVVYRGRKGLLEAIEKALNMAQVQIDSLRLGVIRFYENYYAPGKMAENIVNRSSGGNTLVMNDYRMPR